MLGWRLPCTDGRNFQFHHDDHLNIRKEGREKGRNEHLLLDFCGRFSPRLAGV